MATTSVSIDDRRFLRRGKQKSRASEEKVPDYYVDSLNELARVTTTLARHAWPLLERSRMKALTWMECIRPSFQAINIFNECTTAMDQSRIDSIIDDLSTEYVYLDLHIPFALNVDAATSQLARWEDDSSPSYSIVGVFSCSSNTSLLHNTLNFNLARYLRLFVHLTTPLYTTGYDDYTDEEIRSVRDCIGDRLLRALDPLVHPIEIEASEEKLSKLRSLFLLLLGIVVGMRYTCSDMGEPFTKHIPS